MRINEVEKRAGLKKDNIRYYEKESLLHPKRSLYNDYREYSEDDLRQLKRIKLMRSLGISIKKIKELVEQPEKLDGILNDRAGEIEMEKQNLENTQRILREMLSDKIGFYDIEDEYIRKYEPCLERETGWIFRKDTAEVPLNTEKYNNTVMCFLILGLSVIAFTATRTITWRLCEVYTAQTIFLLVAFSMVAMFTSLFTDNIFVLGVHYLCITAFIMPVFMVLALKFVFHLNLYGGRSTGGIQLILILTILLVLFMCLLRVMIQKNERFFINGAPFFFSVITYNLIVFGIVNIGFRDLKRAAVGTFIHLCVTVMATLVWRRDILEARDYNLYYAIRTSLKILGGGL